MTSMVGLFCSFWKCRSFPVLLFLWLFFFVFALFKDIFHCIGYLHCSGIFSCFLSHCLSLFPCSHCLSNLFSRRLCLYAYLFMSSDQCGPEYRTKPCGNQTTILDAHFCMCSEALKVICVHIICASLWH